MDAALSREIAHPSWSAKTQQATQEKISAIMPKDSAILAVDCRTSLCRVEMSHQSVDDYKNFVHGAYMNPATNVWNGPTFSTLLEGSEGGPVVAVSFLVREGQSMPQMPE